MEGFDKLPIIRPDAGATPRFRAMTRDPGTVYTYWTAGNWRGEGWRVRIDVDGHTIERHDIHVNADDCWFHPPAGLRGEAILETLRDGQYIEVARVPTFTPANAPAPQTQPPRRVRYGHHVGPGGRQPVVTPVHQVRPGTTPAAPEGGGTPVLWEDREAPASEVSPADGASVVSASNAPARAAVDSADTHPSVENVPEWHETMQATQPSGYVWPPTGSTP